MKNKKYIKEKEEINPIPYGGSATVQLNNGIVEDIWYTCYPSLKHQIKKIINIKP